MEAAGRCAEIYDLYPVLMQTFKALQDSGAFPVQTTCPLQNA
jgi:hypothetical protein